MITVHPVWSAFYHILISKGIREHNHVFAVNSVKLENSKAELSIIQLHLEIQQALYTDI
jgi:hypothetical protein